MQSQKTDSGGLVELRINIFGSEKREFYNASGVTALKLISVRHNVSYYGSLRCVDSACSSGNNFWSFELNGRPSLVGVDSYTVRPGDKILLRFGGKTL